MVLERLNPRNELDVCWRVEVIKGGLTGIFRFVVSFLSIKSSALSSFSIS